MTSVDPGRARLLPTRTDLTDAAFVAVLGALALAGLRATYPGWAFLTVGLAGLALGLLVGHLANALRQPVIVMAAAAGVVFFLFGGVIVQRDRGLAGVLPTPGTVRGLAVSALHGWKELLTTLPPVDNGPLLVIPYLLGLLCGAAGLTLARRVDADAPPVVVPAATLGAVILLGTDRPGARLLDGVGFALAAVCWTAVRRHRRRPAVRTGSRRLARAATGAAVLAVAAVSGALAGPWLPGAGAHRIVLREHVTPPFDLSAYPSPLVGFRKYTKDANQLWDQTLFTVSGLPAGAAVRIATLDDYDGSVWGATNGRSGNSFQRVGSRIAVPGTRRETTLRITIAPAYASANDVNAWLPDAGTVTGIEFGGARRAALAGSLRYNVGTSTGIVAERLQSGDAYTVRTVLGSPAVPDDAQPFGPPGLSESGQALVGSRAAKWTKGATGVGARVRAVATFLRDNGAYSDGGPGETEYLPGHSAGRLSSFLNAPRPVGDDEQYAASFALIANSLGMPTRVVLGARPAADGVVRGGDVHAWVEIHLTDGSWAPIPNTDFMPDTSKKPDRQPPQEVENANAAVVPPPNTVRPPTSLGDSSQTDSSSRAPRGTRSALWLGLLALMVTVVTWAGPPVLAVSLGCGSILALKVRRRRRRRTRGSAANRYAGGWRELVDHARDLGAVVPANRTRREEAEMLGWQGFGALAGDADAVVYGPGDPTDGHVAAYWQQVDAARREMTRRARRWRRVLAAVSVRSLRRPGAVPAIGGVTK